MVPDDRSAFPRAMSRNPVLGGAACALASAVDWRRRPWKSAENRLKSHGPLRSAAMAAQVSHVAQEHTAAFDLEQHRAIEFPRTLGATDADGIVGL
jgi:hypothetical protein